MSNATISKTILISGLNNEIARRLLILKNKILSWNELSSNAEDEMQYVICVSKEILELMRTKSQLLDSKAYIFNFSLKDSVSKKAPVENTKKPKRKR
jgi:hypothetical protein